MTSLHRKLLRDLWHLRAMAAAIALVLAGGVATFVMSLATYDSLVGTQQRFYREQRFAALFAGCKRAPLALAERIAAIPGVERVETRVAARVNLDIPGFADPATGQLVSLPEAGEPLLNALYLRRGRLVAPGRDDEVVVSEAFADAHRFRLGDRLAALLNGRRQELTIVGVALSPEYIYQIPPGAVFPDDPHYGILWMGRKALAAAYDLEGAFNDVALTLTADGREQEVIERLDELLRRYGGQGAAGRAEQLSHRFLSEELHGLAIMARVFPLIFLGVAAFLLHVVVTRLVGTQRDQIAILKAFGYGNGAIARHYAGLVTLIVLLGVAVGVALGVWMGHGLAAVYADFYRFPYLRFELRPAVVAWAAAISLAAGLSGTLLAVRRAARLAPAEAMRPETPALYRVTLVERLGLQRWLSQPSRMIARQLERRPGKALLTVAGIAAACGVVMVSNFQEDAVRRMIEVQFGLSEREDLAVTFTDPVAEAALATLRAIPGVRYVEGRRDVAARLRFAQHSYRTALQGMEPGARLQRVLDTALRPIELPAEGVVLTDYLAELLGVKVGDELTVEVSEGAQPTLRLPVAALTKQYIGVNAYLRRDALNRLMREGPAVSGAALAVERDRRAEVYAALKRLPRVAGIVVRENAVERFYQTMEETILFFTLVAAILGGVIAFGMVYNSARIALSERGRELASLRVLGFTHGEIAYILLGELALLVLAAVPLGFLFGRGLCWYLAVQIRSDLYRMPLVLERGSYAMAAAVVLGSALLSGLLIWRKLARLDLIAVLKTRE